MATSPLLWSDILSAQPRKMSQYFEFFSLSNKPTLFYLKVPCINQLQNEKNTMKFALPRSSIAYIVDRDSHCFSLPTKYGLNEVATKKFSQK